MSKPAAKSAKTGKGKVAPNQTAAKANSAKPKGIKLAGPELQETFQSEGAVSNSTATAVRCDREERKRNFGIDTPDSVTWAHWSAGGEYVRKLVIKNTFDRLQVVHYRLPRMKATFFVDFPEPVTLSSGMHFELIIRFRPTAVVEMRDSLEIVVDGRGSFLVDLIALVPYAQLTVPEKHDFNFCPVNATSNTSVNIRNTGTLPLDCTWEIAEPFTISPSSFQLEEGHVMPVKLSFHPTEASAMVAKAVCRIAGSDEPLAVMAVSGIGKYSFIKANGSTTIDFGGQQTGQTVSKSIVVENKACVPASFDLRHISDDIVNPFRFTPTHGTIPREGSVKLSIAFKPESTSASYSNTFVMSAVGGNKLEFRCSGTGLGPSIQLSVRNLDFGDVNIEDEKGQVSKTIQITNKSKVKLDYQFLETEPGNAFQISPSTGSLDARGISTVRITFNPQAAINYLRRIYCVVKHSNAAVYLDLFGTGFNAKNRPAPFKVNAVRYYYLRQMKGLARITPEDIENVFRNVEQGNPPKDSDEEAARAAILSAYEESKVVSKEGNETVLSNVLPDDAHLTMPFSLDEDQVVYRHGATSEAKHVTVRNHTSSKAQAVWAVNGGADPGCAVGMWEVHPQVADVPANGSMTFQVRLTPRSRVTGTFGQHLECYVGHKTMRSFRLVNDKTFSPPQCLTLQVQCVQPQSESAPTPQTDVPDHVSFQACHKGDSVFQVIPIQNRNDTVVSYKININVATHKHRHVDPQTAEMEEENEALENQNVFICHPSSGTIAPNTTTLVRLRFCPPRTQRYRGVAVVSFNESTVGYRTVHLKGEGFLPQLSLSNNGVLSFRPTAVGAQAVREYMVENPSRIPISFQVIVPPEWSKVLSISPTHGSLQGCERKALKAIFSPAAAKRHEVTVPIALAPLHPPNSGECITSTQSCYVVGDGLISVIAVEPLDVNFGTVLVGTECTKPITIFNSSLCDAQFELRYIVHSNSEKIREDQEAPGLTFLPSAIGTLRARSHVNVDVRVTLPHRGDFVYSVYVVSHGSREAVAATEPSREDILRLPHCHVKISGGHPTVEITDARSMFQRKSHLWRQMSVTDVNAALSLPLTNADTETASFTFETASAGLTPIVCDLGVDVYRTAPIRVLVRLDNSGHCPVKFKFWLPHESEVPKEPWQEEAVAGENDIKQAEIIDRKLFDIQPRQATIAPGKHQVIVFTYQHTKVGKHSLPVLLRIDQGKRLLINLTARTLNETSRHLAFHHTLKHDLLPVAIGDLDPPLQYTELQNLGHQTVVYTVDSEALQEVREKNYDFPIFQCLNPQGVIPPMSTLLLSWYFRPIEAKRYEATVAIHVEGGENYGLTLGGMGYHPKKVTPQEVQEMHRRDVFPLPIYPTLKHPLLPLRLTMDVLRFGTVPLHTLHRRVVALQNTHPRDTFAFEWHSVLQYGDQLLDVDPPRGRIAPGETVLMRVTLYTGSTCHVIDNPIHCNVINEDLRNRRLEARETQEEEAAMQLEGPVGERTHSSTNYSGTGGSMAAARQAVTKTKRTEGGKSRLPITSIPAKFQSTIRLRQQIQSLTEAAAAEELDDDDPELIFVDVLPTVLEVVIQARIMQLDTFTDVYGQTAAQEFYFPSFGAHATPLDAEEAKAMQPFSEEELNVARDVIDDLLQGLVHHRCVQDAYCDVSEDPVPYFCQMVEANAPAAERENEDTEETEDGENPSDEVVLGRDGELQCLVEEVLEGLLFDLVKAAQDPEGILSKAIPRSATRRRPQDPALLTQ